MLQRVKFDNSPDEVLGDIYRQLSKFIGDEYLRNGFPRKKELGTMTYELCDRFPPDIFDKIIEFTKIRNNHVHEKKATKKQITKSCALYEEIRLWQNSRPRVQHKGAGRASEARAGTQRGRRLQGAYARPAARQSFVRSGSAGLSGARPFLRAAPEPPAEAAPRRFHRHHSEAAPAAESDRAVKFIGWFLVIVAITGTISLLYLLSRLL